MTVVVGFTIAFTLLGVHLARRSPGLAVADRRAVVGTAATVGFVLGLFVAFVAALAELARVIPS